MAREARPYKTWKAYTGFYEARAEHAFLLRCEGLKLREIGDKFGFSIETARQSIARHARRLKRAMNKTKFYFQ